MQITYFFLPFCQNVFLAADFLVLKSICNKVTMDFLNVCLLFRPVK
jgi:hypothetical protein